MTSAISPDSRIDYLIRELNQADRNYYVNSQTSFADLDYDKLLKELIELEKLNPDLRRYDSPTNRVGSDLDPDNATETVNHLEPMLSVDNCYSIPMVEDWLSKHAKKGYTTERYIVQPKVDGVAVSIHYDKTGKLMYAATRGDGKKGQVITEVCKGIRSIPLQLSKPPGFHLEVRGELYISQADFAELKNQFPEYKNPRNLASGAVQTKANAKQAAKDRKLRFVVHSVPNHTLSVFAKCDNLLDILHELKHKFGLPVIDSHKQATNATEVVDLCNYVYMTYGRSKTGIPVDGAVIKCTSSSWRLGFDFGSKYSKVDIAYKWGAEFYATTTLKHIDWQVGKQGFVTPRATLKPVDLDGSTIKAVSVHNHNVLKDLGLYDGCKVTIHKAGMVIPQIIKVLNPDPDAPRGSCAAPKQIRGRKVTVQGGRLKVTGTDSSQLQEKVLYFCGRDQMDIKGVGPKLVSQLIENGHIKALSDIFRLEKFKYVILNDLERFGEKSLDKIVARINKAKDNGFERLLCAYGFPHIGHTVSKELASRYECIEDVCDASEEDLMQIPGFGKTIVKSIKTHINPEHGEYQDLMIVKEMGASTISRVDKKATKSQDKGPWSGMSFCVTGKFTNMTRQQVHQIVMTYGGEVHHSLKQTTSVLVCGHDTEGGSKITKAGKYNIPCWIEDEFLKKAHECENSNG